MSSTDQMVQVYQLRIWIRHISPQIWRRLLVRSDSTIAQLHDTLQIAFGWTDDHLHRFLIRGKPYGIARSGGIGFDDNPHQVQLRDFHFHWKETWVYEYDLTDWWQHEIRLEQVLPLDPAKRYPLCVAGKRRGPLVIWRKICQEGRRNDRKNSPYLPSSAVFSLVALPQPPEANPTDSQGTPAI